MSRVIRWEYRRSLERSDERAGLLSTPEGRCFIHILQRSFEGLVDNTICWRLSRNLMIVFFFRT